MKKELQVVKEGSETGIHQETLRAALKKKKTRNQKTPVHDSYMHSGFKN